jgi:hypothetical protein
MEILLQNRNGPLYAASLSKHQTNSHARMQSDIPPNKLTCAHAMQYIAGYATTSYEPEEFAVRVNGEAGAGHGRCCDRAAVAVAAVASVDVLVAFLDAFVASFDVFVTSVDVFVTSVDVLRP